MGQFSSWQGMEPASADSLSGTSATNGADAAFCVDPATYASAVLPTAVAQAEAAIRRRQEEEIVAVNLIRSIVNCARFIESGDYATAAGKLAEARVVLATAVPTATGIGRVASHFAAALAHRLFPASPHSSVASEVSPEQAGELYRQFYDAGPYLKFAHFAANQTILEAFEGCDRVHIVDLAITQGVQWPALIQALSIRPGGPPTVRITGVSSSSSPTADEVGVRLTELARAVSVPFSYQTVTSDSLDALQPWMFQVLPGEAVAVNSICQLHRLLVDQDAASTSLPKPIDVVLGWVAAMQPRVFTVVEQEVDVNKPSLHARFSEALFYYGGVFDSMEAMTRMRGGASGNGAGADAYVQREIFDIVCGEGSARKERYEQLSSWYDRFRRAGLVHVLIGPSAAYQAAMLVHVFSGAGFRVLEIAGCLLLAWHERPLLTASVWRAMPGSYAGKGDNADMQKLKMNVGEGSSSQGAAGGTAMQ